MPEWKLGRNGQPLAGHPLPTSHVLPPLSSRFDVRQVAQQQVIRLSHHVSSADANRTLLMSTRGNMNAEQDSFPANILVAVMNDPGTSRLREMIRRGIVGKGINSRLKAPYCWAQNIYESGVNPKTLR